MEEPKDMEKYLNPNDETNFHSKWQNWQHAARSSGNQCRFVVVVSLAGMSKVSLLGVNV